MRKLTWLTAALAAVFLASCATPTPATSPPPASPSDTASPTAASPTAAANASFPVIIKHAFGQAEIPAAPQRVVTWGWGSTEAVLALGVVPVAIPQMTYGANAAGVLAWVANKLTEIGAPTPTILAAGSGEVPIEQVAAAKPDLILAPYSGLTAAEYGALAPIAPVVAYPDKPWATDWREVIMTTAQALGKTTAGTELLRTLDAEVAAVAAAHPQFQGVTVAQVWNTPDSFAVYLPADPRVQFMHALGFTTAPAVTALDTGESTFYYTLSREKLDELTSDVLVAYADTSEQLTEFENSPAGQLMSQVKNKKVAAIIGPDKIAAVSPPTALSLTYGLSDFVNALVKALQ